MNGNIAAPTAGASSDSAARDTGAIAGMVPAYASRRWFRRVASWSIWSSGSGGCITPSGNTAAFKATWSNSGDFLARMGFQWDETKTFDQYGTVGADFAYTFDLDGYVKTCDQAPALGR